MNRRKLYATLTLGGIAAMTAAWHHFAYSQEVPKRGASSYIEVVITEPFEKIRDRMVKAKPEIMERQKALLESRYDLGDRPAKDVTMSDRPKPIQEGVRAKLPKGVESWDQLAAMNPEEIREKN